MSVHPCACVSNNRRGLPSAALTKSIVPRLAIYRFDGQHLRQQGERAGQSAKKMVSCAAIGKAGLLALYVACFVCCTLAYVRIDKPQYCSFFNNRAPSAQPGIRNCTWFKENSCCLQQEIEATFGRVKPLQGASPACQRYVNYLMCYICAPDQNLFYQGERLTVCEQFCDAWYEACGLAVLKGSIIRDLYPNGRQFCRSRRFKVARTDGCFSFDIALDTSSGMGHLSPCLHVIVALSLFCVLASRMPGTSRANYSCGTDHDINDYNEATRASNVVTNAAIRRNDSLVTSACKRCYSSRRKKSLNPTTCVSHGILEQCLLPLVISDRFPVHWARENISNIVVHATVS